MSNVRATLVVIPVLAFVLLIPTLIGIYVYRDAKQRKSLLKFFCKSP